MTSLPRHRVQTGGYRAGVGRAHGARDFVAVFQKHQRRPELERR